MGDDQYKEDSEDNIIESDTVEQPISEQEAQQDEIIEEEQTIEEIHKEKPAEKKKEHKVGVVVPKDKKPLKQRLIDFYDTRYKQMLYITLSLMIISWILIGIQIYKTGDFINKDISLTGGITLTILTDQQVDVADLETYLNTNFPNDGISVRSLTELGSNIGIIIDGTNFDSEELVNSLSSKISGINKEDYTANMIGSSLGSTFFKETLKAIYVSFLFMGLVVFLYFGESLKMKIISSILTITAALMIFAGGTHIIKDIIAYILGAIILFIYFKNSAPSFMMIVNVFADLTLTLAIVNLIGMKVSTAGIASFLMIIGYCVESNILLTTKVIKKKEGVLIDKIVGAFNTGFIMTLTAITAVTIALVMTQSSVIKEIMAILLIGLFADLIFTWIQNVALLRIYIDKQRGRHEL
jgi:preprotein translocase subunit SecF